MPDEGFPTNYDRPGSDEAVVRRVHSMKVGERELLSTGRIGTKMGKTQDGRIVLMDSRGELLCEHGEQNSLIKRQMLKNPICACKKFDNIIFQTHKQKNPQYTYGLAQNETLHDFLEARREEGTTPLWAYESVFIHRKNGVERIVCKCGKGVHAQIDREKKMAEAVEGVLRAHPETSPTADTLAQIVASEPRYAVACFFAWLKDELPEKAVERIDQMFTKQCGSNEIVWADKRTAWARAAKDHEGEVPRLSDVMRCTCPSLKVRARDGSHIKYDFKSKRPSDEFTGRRANFKRPKILKKHDPDIIPARLVSDVLAKQ